MENVVEFEDPDFNDIDLDSILQGFPDDFGLDLDLWLPDIPIDESNSPNSISSGESDSPNSLSSYVEEIEKFVTDGDAKVTEEGDKGFVDDDFFYGLIVDGSDSGKSEVTTIPDSGAAEEENEGKEKRREEGEDPVSKKRRRQMRNRDSAMKSRERKKMYVKDLEMKSRYLESECRRLDYALRCCVAENLALHQHLQKERPLGSLIAKQESAVLFVESLLLGSLFWLVSIMCLFLISSLRSPNLKDTSSLGRGLVPEAVGSKTAVSKNLRLDLVYELVIMRRRCRGMRTRMKLFLFPLHTLSP